MDLLVLFDSYTVEVDWINGKEESHSAHGLISQILCIQCPLPTVIRNWQELTFKHKCPSIGTYLNLCVKFKTDIVAIIEIVIEY